MSKLTWDYGFRTSALQVKYNFSPSLNQKQAQQTRIFALVGIINKQDFALCNNGPLEMYFDVIQ